MTESKLFLVKLDTIEPNAEGILKNVTKQFLVRAFDTNQASDRITSNEGFNGVPIDITSISAHKVSELFINEDGEYIYDFKVAFIILDEKTCKEKETNVRMIVRANDLFSACKIFKHGMEDSMVDYRVIAVKETPIVEVYNDLDTEN